MEGNIMVFDNLAEWESIWIENKTGPKTKPCGTPQVMGRRVVTCGDGEGSAWKVKPTSILDANPGFQMV